jgi:hypothetical protein
MSAKYFYNPSETLLAVLATLEEHLSGEIVVRDLVEVECKTDRATALVNYLAVEQPRASVPAVAPTTQ